LAGGPSEDAAFDNPEHNIYRALEAWVETGTAPEKVIASMLDNHGGKPTVTLSRPLCPYPQSAAYSGSGDRNSAASYVCTARK
jgi:feruloyl esterase